MPVSYNSVARNLFLLGASGADAVVNFFKSVDKSPVVAFTEGAFVPSGGIKYDQDKFLISGRGYANDSFVWIDKRDYNVDNTRSTPDWENRIQPTVYSSYITLEDMELDSNSNVIVVGKWGGVNGDYGTCSCYIVKYNSAGVLQWQSTSNTGDLEYTGVTSDSNGNYYACGNTPNTFAPGGAPGEAEAFVEKFDGSGAPLWGKAAIMLGRDVVLKRISANSRGEVVAVGYLEDDSVDKGYIVKIDTNTGKVLWDRTLERSIAGSAGTIPADVRCTSCYIDSNDQIYIVGSVDGNNPVNNGVGEFLIKYTAEGNIVWQRENNTDHYTALDGEPNMIPFDVWSDSETEQTVVLSVEDQGSFALNDSDVFISKYNRNGDIVFRRKISKGGDNLGTAAIDGDPSYYYMVFRDQQIQGLEPDRYTFGKVSSSGNGLGTFNYNDGSGSGNDVDYIAISNPENKIGKMSDGSVSNNSSDLMSYPFTANKLVFDDLATNISNKKRQMDSADSFQYSGSPAIRVADFQELNLLGDTGVVDTGLGSPLLVDSRGDGVYSNIFRNMAQQASANNNQWVNNNAAWTDAVAEGAWNFDDSIPSTMSFDIQNLLSTANTTPFTLEAWAQREDGGRWQTVVSIANSWVQMGFDSNNKITCGRNGGGGGKNARSSIVSEANRWYHIVMSYNGNQTGSDAYIDIYVDGVKDKSQINMGVNSFGGNGVNLYLGRYAGGNGELLDGYVGEVRLYNRALNSAEVAQNYNASKERFTGEPQFGKVLTNDVDVSWGDQSKNGYKAYVGNTPPTYSASDGSWEFDGNGTTTRDQLTIDIEEFQVYGWEMWFENYNTINNNDNNIGGPSAYQVLASWAYPAGITLGGWTSGATNESIQFWSRDGGNGVTKSTYLQTEVPIGKHHLFIRWNNSSYEIYIDGLKQTTYNHTNGKAELVTYKGKCIHIGGNNENYYFHGKIFETRLYTKEVTRAQVYQNYNATKSKYINEAPDTAPKIGSTVVLANGDLNYDFGNRATYDPVENRFTSSANLLKYSDGTSFGRLTDWSWLGASTPEAIPNSAIAPDGSLTAWKVSGPSLYQSIINDGDFTMSAWVKTVDGSSASVQQSVYLLGTGGDVLSTTHTATGDWQRITFSSVATSIYGNPAGKYHRYTPFASSADLYVWAPQVELKSSVGRYVPTYGTAITPPTTVKNLSSSPIPGTINLAPYNSGGWFEFDGSGNSGTRIVFDSSGIDLSGSFSIDMWFRQGEQNADYYMLLGASGYGGVGENGIGHYLFANSIRTWAQDSLGSNTTINLWDSTSTNPLTLGVWYNLILTRQSGNAWRWYLNGSLVNSNTTDFLTVDFTSATTYVGDHYNSDYQFDGDIAEVRMYDTALDSTEVSQNFNATRSKYGV